VKLCDENSKCKAFEYGNNNPVLDKKCDEHETQPLDVKERVRVGGGGVNSKPGEVKWRLFCGGKQIISFWDDDQNKGNPFD
jgi:hypothetical protein